ncbi:MAG: GNAT family protein [bacterium]
MVLLEKFIAKDIPSFISWLKDTDAEFLVQFAGPKYKYPLDENQILQTLNDKNYIVFKAIDEKLNIPIGHCQLMEINFINKTAAIGRVLVRKEYRNKNYGYEMLMNLVKYSKDILDLKKLTLRVFDFNIAAINCYKKIGFVEIKNENVYFKDIGKTWKCLTLEYQI